MHSDYTPAGYLRGSHDGYWAAVEAREHRRRYAGLSFAIPEPQTPAPKPMDPAEAEARFESFVENRYLNRHGD